MTTTTADLCDILLKDSMKVMKLRGLEPSYSAHDLNLMYGFTKIHRFGELFRVGRSELRFFDAGHVPGSAGTLIETHGKKIFYTGDVKFDETRLMKAADTSFNEINTLICESTYSYKDHPDRKRVEDSLKELIQYTYYNNGIVLLPSFAVGRTQEILLIISELGLPIYLDGMGIDATKRILQNQKGCRSHEKLKKAFGAAKKIKKQKQRIEALRNPCVVITTAGMLSGGPVHNYIQKIHGREDCTMILSGFQVPGTVGRTLLDTGRYVREDLDVKPKMRTEFMDFSAHCGRTELIDFIKKSNPENVFLVHGERTEEFAKELREMGFNAFGPKNGDRFSL
jgi:putative mRNA 3-end processing factor